MKQPSSCLLLTSADSRPLSRHLGGLTSDAGVMCFLAMWWGEEAPSRHADMVPGGLGASAGSRRDAIISFRSTLENGSGWFSLARRVKEAKCFTFNYSVSFSGDLATCNY